MIRTELTVRLPNNAGALAGVFRLLADAPVHIAATSLGEGGHLRLLVDNPVHAAGVLRDQRHVVSERDVLVVEPAVAVNALRLVADAGININYAYGALSALVIGVDDALRASAAAGV